MAANLPRLRALGVFPCVLAQYRNELWLEYVEGKPLDAATTPAEELADVFAALYTADSRLVALAEQGAREQVERDIDFLGRSRVLKFTTVSALTDVAARSAPAQAWIGYDYSDARAQNFLRAPDGRLRIIDVESIRRDALIGTGVVRACIRWPHLDAKQMAARLTARGVPEFSPYWDFLEIAFLAGWTKRCVLQKKAGLIDVPRLERIAARK
jgi:hypothetical protein